MKHSTKGYKKREFHQTYKHQTEQLVFHLYITKKRVLRDLL